MFWWLVPYGTSPRECATIYVAGTLAPGYPLEQMLRNFSRQGRAILLSLYSGTFVSRAKKTRALLVRGSRGGPHAASCSLVGRSRTEAAKSVVGTGKKGRAGTALQGFFLLSGSFQAQPAY